MFTYGLLCLTYGLLCLTSGSSAFCNQLSSMPLYYACLARLLCLPGLLCLLLPSMPTRSPAPVSTYTESICLVILPHVLPSLLPTVPSVVFMYSTYIIYIVSYAYLVCYDYMLVMPKCLLCPPMRSAMVCPTMPTHSLLPTLSSAPAVPMCLSSNLCLILSNNIVLLYSLLCFSSVQHFKCTLMFSYVTYLDTYFKKHVQNAIAMP